VRGLAASQPAHGPQSFYRAPDGWSGTSNGELLLLAADGFDVFLTVDRNLSFQQAIRHLEIAVVILRARTNRLSDLQLLIPHVLKILPEAQKGRIMWVGG
jgi:hypothetical protein